MNLATLDRACAAHLQHSAMALDDPLTTAVCEQCCAPEGAQLHAHPPSSALTPEQWAALREAERDPVLGVLLVLGASLAAALSWVWPWGVVTP